MPTPDEPRPAIPEPGLDSVTDEQVARVRAKANELGLDPYLLRSLVEILNDLIEEGLNHQADWLLRYLIAHLGEEETIRRLEMVHH